MDNTIQIECPPELLPGLQMNAEKFAATMKFHTAVALFKEGRISSEMAAKWLNMLRTMFLEDSADDFNRETALNLALVEKLAFQADEKW